MITMFARLTLIVAVCGDVQSSSTVLEEAAIGREDRARLVVEIQDDRAESGHPMPLPVRVIATASDGSHLDGSGRGVYADGRFFADGQFTVDAPPGATTLVLDSGPNYEPLKLQVDAKAGRQSRVRARLHRWFSPEDRGWYAGDNHVHAQHDATAAIRTDLEFTALQARADGLSYITEADAGPTPADIERLSTPTFLFRRAPEQRPGPFVGHLNTPGVTSPFTDDEYRAIVDRPLPAQALVAAVHKRDGAVIHTHPMTPPHQLHWMGAAEFFSDAVMGQCADALDIDGMASELLWSTALNLGNRVACSGYTDCALGRKNTPSPGDRRVYSHAKELTYPGVVEAIRRGRTFSTNGGPVFPFLTVDGSEPGDSLSPNGGKARSVRIEIHSLYPLKEARLIRRGRTHKVFDVADKVGEVILEGTAEDGDEDAAWFALRVEDRRGHWAITSPVFVGPARSPSQRTASALILEINNATRYTQLRRQFFAHILVTVSPGERLQSIELLRDGEVVRQFLPSMGDQRADGRVPVTALRGDYGPGWEWYPSSADAVHFQGDWPVDASGWYGLRATTNKGRVLSSDELHFDGASGASRTIDVAHLEGPETRLVHHGYGEEMPLESVQIPFKGDHWWYPQRNYWRLHASFGHDEQEVGSGANATAEARFRSAHGRPGKPQ